MSLLDLPAVDMMSSMSQNGHHFKSADFDIVILRSNIGNYKKRIRETRLKTFEKQSPDIKECFLRLTREESQHCKSLYLIGGRDLSLLPLMNPSYNQEEGLTHMQIE